jgi:hypothetical protein
MQKPHLMPYVILTFICILYFGFFKVLHLTAWQWQVIFMCRKSLTIKGSGSNNL